MVDTSLSALHAGAKTAVPAGADILISVPSSGGRTFDALSPAALAGSPGPTGIIVDGSTVVASTGSPYQMATADRVVVVNKTTGAATKLLLPTNPILWVEYKIKDGKGDATTNNITVTGASGVTIDGISSFPMNANLDAITIFAVNATTWFVS